MMINQYMRWLDNATTRIHAHVHLVWWGVIINKYLCWIDNATTRMQSNCT